MSLSDTARAFALELQERTAINYQNGRVTAQWARECLDPVARATMEARAREHQALGARNYALCIRTLQLTR